MRIVFAGTPEFAVESLAILHKSNHEIIAVYCQPDRPKGRGKVLSVCPVKLYAEENNLLVIQPEDFSELENQERFALLKPDVMVVAAYGQILPKNTLQTPRFGCLNIHASLLPRWRGAAPIERAILAGDKETGISIMQMNEGLDTGNVLLEKKHLISDFETSHSLTDSLSSIGASAIIETLAHLSDLEPKPQNNIDAIYAKKITKSESQIDWNQSAETISRIIRAFNPRPIAQTNAKAKQFENNVLRITEAEVIQDKTIQSPGTIIEYGKGFCYVATANGVLSLKKVQLAGKKEVSIKDFNNAYQLIELS
ncbi:MAG: methionyl-tRNA formyltransferase [Candidatus Marinimicrobia bacterium]|nr:methionyl-tRNA formyltransferase [Candidatus Neomarinimicrobiota bacterium]